MHIIEYTSSPFLFLGRMFVPAFLVDYNSAHKNQPKELSEHSNDDEEGWERGGTVPESLFG